MLEKVGRVNGLPDLRSEIAVQIKRSEVGGQRLGEAPKGEKPNVGGWEGKGREKDDAQDLGNQVESRNSNGIQIRDFSALFEPQSTQADGDQEEEQQEPRGVEVFKPRTATSTNSFLPSTSSLPASKLLPPSVENGIQGSRSREGLARDESQNTTKTSESRISSGLETTPHFLPSNKKKTTSAFKNQQKDTEVNLNSNSNSNSMSTINAAELTQVWIGSDPRTRTAFSNSNRTETASDLPFDPRPISKEDKLDQNGTLVESWLAKGQEASLVSPSKPASPPKQPSKSRPTLASALALSFATAAVPTLPRSCFKGAREREMEGQEPMGATLADNPDLSMSRVDETRPNGWISRGFRSLTIPDSVTDTSSSPIGRQVSARENPLSSGTTVPILSSSPSSPPPEASTGSARKRKSPEVEEVDGSYSHSSSPNEAKKARKEISHRIEDQEVVQITPESSKISNSHSSSRSITSTSLTRSKTLPSFSIFNTNLSSSNRSLLRSSTFPTPASTSNSGQNKIVPLRTCRESPRLMDAMFHVFSSSSGSASGLSIQSTEDFLRSSFKSNFISSMTAVPIAASQSREQTWDSSSRSRLIFIVVSREKMEKENSEALASLKNQVKKIKSRVTKIRRKGSGQDKRSKIEPCHSVLRRFWANHSVQLIDEGMKEELSGLMLQCEIECGQVDEKNRREELEKGIQPGCCCCSHLIEIKDKFGF